METMHIEQELVITAEPQRVFEALTTGVDAWWMQGFESPHSTFHLEPVAGGRFYEDFDQGRGSALYATVTYLEPSKKLRMTGPMGMRGPVMGNISGMLMNSPIACSSSMPVFNNINGALPRIW